MAFDRPHPLSLAFPIAAVGLAADDADARFSYGGPYCDPTTNGYAPTTGDYCDGFASIEDLIPADVLAIPIDGALALELIGDWDPGVLDRITAAVTRDGVDVPGALETTIVPGWLVWRPQDPFAPDADHQFTATLSNAGVSTACAPTEIPVAFDFTTVDDPAPPLVALTLTGEASVMYTPIVGLDTLACCPDVAPTLIQDECGGAAVLSFDPQQCTPLSAVASLTVDLEAVHDAPTPPLPHILYDLLIDGAAVQEHRKAAQLSLYVAPQDQPFCASVRAHDVVTGTSVDGPTACFGADLADELGPQTLAPPDGFTCSLRRCEIEDDTWDLEACTPLDPDHPNEPAPASEPEKLGCGCAGEDPAGGLGLLALAGLLVATRRRSRGGGRPG